MTRTLLAAALALALAGHAAGREPIRLANHPALSPDGKTLAFDYAGDVWTVPSAGGAAKPLTQNPAKDTSPKFSPDGKEIAFVSERDGSPQVYVMPAAGGAPKQVTFHTAGFALHEWAPDGNHVLVSAMRDHAWSRRQPERFYLVNVRERQGERLLFDDYGTSGTFSPDGKKLLFTREGMEWWRKGYVGSASSQVWVYDLQGKTFEPILAEEIDHRWPLWKPDGKGIYFCTGTKNGFVLQEMDLGPRPVTARIERKPINARTVASFPDDSVAFPCISRDGSAVVFRHLFDLYRLEPGKNGASRIEIWRDDDRTNAGAERRVLDRANAVSFTNDGLEIAFTAGGDLWVMDTELREPRRVTKTAEEERDPVFAPDGNSVLFVSDAGGSTDVWRATRADGKKPWWLNTKFRLEKVTDDGEAKSSLTFSPDGSKMAYVRGRGDLWVADADGKNAKKVIASWNPPDYDWSPDARWLVYALYDNDFNRDIWIKPVDGSRPPFNLSRHPFNEGDPVWSPDGRVIAYVGAHEDKSSTDIHFVYLRVEDDQKNNRDRAIEKALEKLQKGRATKTSNPSPDPSPRRGGEEEVSPPFPLREGGPGGLGSDQPEPGPAPRVKDDKKGSAPTTKKGVPEVVIDFDGIHDRIRRVPIANSSESNLFWSPDSKKLAFTGVVDGQPGTFTIELPENLKPTQLSSQTGTQARWLRNGSVVWLSGGVPGSVSGTPGPAPATTTAAPAPKGTGRFGGRAGGAPAAGGYRFTAYQETDLAKKHQAAFDMCWRTMRDNWYDDRMGNRDWKAIREKYLAIAETPDQDTLATVVQLMLGELNGSHLGFFAGSMSLPARRGPGAPPEEPSTADRKWNLVTANLGIRFDESYQGPGLRVRDVLPDGPADLKRNRVTPGELVVAIDGVPVDSSKDLTEVLNGHPSRDVLLKVRGEGGKEREVMIRPITWAAARNLVYKKWLKDNRAMVDKLSNGTLGYLHVRAMDMRSFHEFEEDLYNAGAGKAGLVIDVRENGGGSTADHLLTALTQPRHAVAVPRGGGPGYPQDRTVYATWNKPIVVLCNQNSFSNAEIFSHAVKTLKRGKLVGVPTAGGVISTGGTAIMDVGFLRLPFRGWYLLDSGEDMELNGAVPHHIVWPSPGDMPRGKDDQIAKAVEVLIADVKEWTSRPRPKLHKATERE